jgi:hypothetical protein
MKLINMFIDFPFMLSVVIRLVIYVSLCKFTDFNTAVLFALADIAALVIHKKEE